ncbi:hypothetical protein NPN18_25295, partial [Vibrio parahaemolyticus]|nr:hypothetical protein [Vibrio parahaemolyticus]
TDTKKGTKGPKADSAQYHQISREKKIKTKLTKSDGSHHYKRKAYQRAQSVRAGKKGNLCPWN